MQRPQALLGAAVLAAGLMFGAGATQIGGEAVYSGVGANFLPWVVAVGLTLGGALLLWEAFSGGFRQMEEASGAEHGHWAGAAWVSAGILLTAALINHAGFIVSCTLCFVLAVRGFKSAAGKLDLSPRAWLADVLIGAAIAAPVFWLFTKALAINLPGLTSTGWL